MPSTAASPTAQFCQSRAAFEREQEAERHEQRQIAENVGGGTIEPHPLRQGVISQQTDNRCERLQLQASLRGLRYRLNLAEPQQHIGARELTSRPC